VTTILPRNAGALAYRTVLLKGCFAFIFITRLPGSALKRFYELEESVG
jgi:hypothetical protein